MHSRSKDSEVNFTGPCVFKLTNSMVIETVLVNLRLSSFKPVCPSGHNKCCSCVQEAECPWSILLWWYQSINQQFGLWLRIQMKRPQHDLVGHDVHTATLTELCSLCNFHLMGKVHLGTYWYCRSMLWQGQTVHKLFSHFLTQSDFNNSCAR